MNQIFNLLFICLFCAVLGLNRIPIRTIEKERLFSKIVRNNCQNDKPLTVELVEIGDRFAVFNINGGDTICGKPIKTLFVNYTVDGPTSEIRIEKITTKEENGNFNQTVKVPGFNPGLNYTLQFSGQNGEDQRGPPSRPVNVLLLPPTPDITVLHPSLHKLKVIWGEKRSKSEDYYLLTVEKKSCLGCGLTLNLTSCFGDHYTLDELEVGQIYVLSMKAHNPSGFSDPVVVTYPIE